MNGGGANAIEELARVDFFLRSIFLGLALLSC